MDAEAARAVTYTQTDTQDNYSNPRACAPRVNNYIATKVANLEGMRLCFISSCDFCDLITRGHCMFVHIKHVMLLGWPGFALFFTTPSLAIIEARWVHTAVQ